MADMAMLAKLAMLAALPLTQDGQLGLLTRKDATILP
jgi:hypothetical protein